MDIRFALVGGVGLAALAAASPAAATPGFGSAAENTYRDCGAAGPSDPCDGQRPGQQIILKPITGGVSSGANTMLSLPDGSYANSSVGFGAFDLPVIHGETFAAGNNRMNVNAFGYQTYTYTGDGTTPFSITGSLHIVDSSTNGVPDGAPDPDFPGQTLLGGVLPNGAIGLGYVGIWDSAIVSSFTDAQSIFDNLFLAQCGTAGVLGVGMISQSLPGGETTLSATTSACAPGALTLTPGQEVLVVAGLQLPVNRGGFVNALHTFTTELDPTLPPEVRENLREHLISGLDILGVPEPGTWALMLLGFGGAGAALRRRRAEQGCFL